ncbi:hypothetical protein R5R35_001255 [Gryllus longicercus]|uniref:CCDC81 HU domain-containing protein n=1 Tax=Gryllus longicercus TaxID=2509291 RepID=A0AAN9VIW3_9ORTH
MNVFDSYFKTTWKRNYSRDDVTAIWNIISQQVVERLHNGNAVCITGLGTFTLSEWKIHNGSKICLQKLQPVFILSKRLSEFYHVKVVETYTADRIPLKKLSFSAVSKISGIKRHTVENIITEVTQVFVQLIGRNVDTEFPLAGIGKIEIKNKVLNVMFDMDFVEKVTKANTCTHEEQQCIKRFYTFPYNSGHFWTT